jgi:hypothetical protein
MRHRDRGGPERPGLECETASQPIAGIPRAVIFGLLREGPGGVTVYPPLVVASRRDRALRGLDPCLHPAWASTGTAPTGSAFRTGPVPKGAPYLRVTAPPAVPALSALERALGWDEV